MFTEAAAFAFWGQKGGWGWSTSAPLQEPTVNRSRFLWPLFPHRGPGINAASKATGEQGRWQAATNPLK